MHINETSAKLCLKGTQQFYTHWQNGVGKALGITVSLTFHRFRGFLHIVFLFFQMERSELLSHASYEYLWIFVYLYFHSPMLIYYLPYNRNKMISNKPTQNRYVMITLASSRGFALSLIFTGLFMVQFIFMFFIYKKTNIFYNIVQRGLYT